MYRLGSEDEAGRCHLCCVVREARQGKTRCKVVQAHPQARSIWWSWRHWFEEVVLGPGGLAKVEAGPGWRWLLAIE